VANHQDNQGLDSNLLAQSAARAARWPHLFSSIIDRYLALNNMGEAELCSQLHCDRTTLNHLRLCGRPDLNPAEFATDVQRVADRFGLDAGKLASIVREVDAADAFSQAQRNVSQNKGRSTIPFSYTPGMLRAARDNEEAPGPEGGPDSESEKPDEGQIR